MTDKPAVLFVCVHNAGRSQMAAGYLTELAHGAIEVRSAGSLPGDQINPAAVRAMAEEGIDIADQTPRILTTESVQASDVVITMGCGDACRSSPGNATRTGNWKTPPGKASRPSVASAMTFVAACRPSSTSSSPTTSEPEYPNDLPKLPAP